MTPSFNEKYTSQLPALQMLCALGWQYLAPQQAMAERGGRAQAVLLGDILREQLRRINAIHYRGKDYAFSDSNIEAAVRTIGDVSYETEFELAGRDVYNLLTQGKSFEQSVGGDRKSFALRYIDWENPANNTYHVTAEYSVVRSGSSELYTPDIVLFVNGIPLVVIECKSPVLKDALGQAVSQHLRNQQEGGIRALYVYAQVLLALAGHKATYGTTAATAEYWGAWHEEVASHAEAAYNAELHTYANTPPTAEQRERLFLPPFAQQRASCETLWQHPRLVTEQDKLLYALCRPERLLEIVRGFIVYEHNTKKLCRYQQYFGVQSLQRRIAELDEGIQRKGGTLWHTQGSGKSLTMLFFAQYIAMERAIPNAQIVLVTDRVDLDDQLYETFQKCGKRVYKATTGRDLLAQLDAGSGVILTTVIHKFAPAVKHASTVYTSPNIFVLVDEAHRSQYKNLAAKMRRVFPNGCFIGFTGTPLTKKEKNTVNMFGGIVHQYLIDRAVADGAVVPLLYEGRHVELDVQANALDYAFSHVAESMPEYGVDELKRAASSRARINEAELRIEAVARDISEHFVATWRGSGFKGQLVTPNKRTAVRYKQALDDIGSVSSEVLISPPDEREGHLDIYNADVQSGDVQRFWANMMHRYHNPKQYAEDVIKRFKGAGAPDIVIVVDKLLTGFDAPRNVVLYVARPLREHTLLQAIARVNRVFPGKEYGYIIDYEGVLGKLDEAMQMYSGLQEFDSEDVQGLLHDVQTEIAKLPQLHSAVWELFGALTNQHDTEAFAAALRDDEQRDTFHERVRAFARCWHIALSSRSFAKNTAASTFHLYESDIAFFLKLRAHVQRRYSDKPDAADYEPQVRKLIDRYVTPYGITPITELVNIFDAEQFQAEVEKMESNAARADTIASRTSRYIAENMEKDPHFYTKLSAMIRQTIDDYKQGRVSEAEYLQKVKEQRDAALHRTDESLPAALRERGEAQAFYGVLLDALDTHIGSESERVQVCANAALAIDDLLREHLLDNGKPIVEWQSNSMVEGQLRIDIGDYLYDHLKEPYALALTLDDIEQHVAYMLDIAKIRYKE